RSAVADVIAHLVNSLVRIGMRSGHDARDVSRHWPWQKDAIHRRENPPKLLAAHHEIWRGRLAPPPCRDYSVERFDVGAGYVELEEKAVELRFGQRVSALEFNRVLRREHEERIGQLAGRAEQRHGALLHGFEQGRLSLRRGAVDLVGEQQVGEDRARVELHRAAAVMIFLKDVRAQDVARHQVWRELHAAELQVEQSAEGLDQRRLPDSRQSFEQNVPTTQNAGEYEAMKL